MHRAATDNTTRESTTGRNAGGIETAIRTLNVKVENVGSVRTTYEKSTALYLKCGVGK